MRKYVIERRIPGVGNMPQSELAAVTAKSNGILAELGPGVQWQHSYVTADKLYCVYLAETPDPIREHARRGGFPIDSLEEVVAIIDPTTAGTR